MKIHLDTDIGGDIDDLCALALLLNWPDAEITAVTTVADEGGRRAGYARYALQLADRPDIPVAAGADVALGCYRVRPGYPRESTYWPEPVPPSPNALDDALELLRASIEAGAAIVGAGPYTNLALLERKHPGLLQRAKLFLMGGWVFPVPPGYPRWGNEMDWNIQEDVQSAREVVQCCRPTLIPLTVTVQTALRRSYLPGLRASGPLGALIARQAEAYGVDQGNEERYGRTCPRLPGDIINFQHDPLACAVALGWDGVTIDQVPLKIEVRDGWLYERVAPAGEAKGIVTAVDGDRFDELWYRTVTARRSGG